MSSGRIAHHRNYGKLMARHKHDLKLKKLLRVFIITVYFLLVCLIIIFIIFRNWETKQKDKPGKAEPTTMVKPLDEI
jgi:flagellar basal body-associated protein FliL